MIFDLVLSILSTVLGSTSLMVAKEVLTESKIIKRVKRFKRMRIKL